MLIKDSPLKMNAEKFAEELKSGEERSIKVTFVVKGIDAETLISLVNLAKEEESFEKLLEVIFHHGLIGGCEAVVKNMLGLRK